MATITGWHIGMEFVEDDSHTESAAVLRLRDGTELRAGGRANRHPHDPQQQLVGEEIAAARALNDLARQLLEKANSEIERVTHEDAHVTL